MGTQHLRPVLPSRASPEFAKLITRSWAENPEERPFTDEVLKTLESIDFSPLQEKTSVSAHSSINSNPGSLGNSGSNSNSNNNNTNNSGREEESRGDNKNKRGNRPKSGRKNSGSIAINPNVSNASINGEASPLSSGGLSGGDNAIRLVTQVSNSINHDGNNTPLDES